jgi:opacity protein-like surface antigen
MRNNILLSLLFLFVINLQLVAQKNEAKQLPSIALGVGVLTFNGDINRGSLSSIKAGYNLTVEQRIGSCFGVSLNGIYGELSDNERSANRNLNFYSKIIQADIAVQFHLDNDFIFKRNSPFAPYVFIGLGYLKFDPKGDLKDHWGDTYHYWSDGTIRSLPESSLNVVDANILKRDYTYETNLKDSLTNYSRGAVSFPVGLMFNLKMTNNLSANIGASYYLTLTDWIDNIKSNKNDGYLYGNFSLKYTFTQKTNNFKNYSNVDFASIDNQDTDEDGVKDLKDECTGTPKGVKVDSKGCPEDSDKDGVEDYRDKELTTKKGATVDEFGITQTDELLASKQAKFDSLATERSEIFNQNPSLSYLEELDSKAIDTRKNNIDKKNNIPSALRAADTNNDGYISSIEIKNAINGFFDGTSSFTVEKLNDLIDYFFEQ